MSPLQVYAPFHSPRLHYVLDWILGERLGCGYALTQDKKATVHLSIGSENEAAVFLPNCEYLFQKQWQQNPIDSDTWSLENLQFDVLSAIFFLLARVEEYLTFAPDRHGRYEAKNSVLFQKGWLGIPVVDVWVELLRTELNKRFALHLSKPAFSFQPTYDIDIAYSYLHKGFRRTIGGLLRDAQQRHFQNVNARLKTLSGKAPDPYDAFDDLRSLHTQHGLKPVYFILAAQGPGRFDKNISPRHPVMKMLAQSFALEGTVGIHPSYTTAEIPEKILSEKRWLEAETGKPIHHSRQHYIRLRFPKTYQQLLAAGITEDWSMGYPDALGFRAATSHVFPWYDLEQEQQTALRIHPFCFMDTTARDYLHLSAPEAFAALENLRKVLQEIGGQLTTVFHNFSLATATDWPGWPTGYKVFLKSL